VVVAIIAWECFHLGFELGGGREMVRSNGREIEESEEGEKKERKAVVEWPDSGNEMRGYAFTGPQSVENRIVVTTCAGGSPLTQSHFADWPLRLCSRQDTLGPFRVMRK
jgi:hypothetical protein